jgi:hypothetical protein
LIISACVNLKTWARAGNTTTALAIMASATFRKVMTFLPAGI